MPRFSVIIPAYNSAQYLEQAIDSALDQTVGDLEVVVIDDGSTDDTRTIAEQFLPDISLLTQKNQGPAAARNLGIRNSNGELVAFLDADDWWRPERLERMAEILDSSPSTGFVTTDAYLVVGDQVTKKTYYGSLPRRQQFRSHNQGFWIARTDFIFVGTLVRRDLLNRHGHFDESLKGPEDWDLWMRFIASGEHAELVPEPLAYYRVREGSLSHARLGLLLPELVLYEKALKDPITKSLPGISGMAHYAHGRAALLGQKSAEARLHFAAAARDKELGNKERLKAAAVAMAPMAAWAAYRVLLWLRGQSKSST